MRASLRACVCADARARAFARAPARLLLGASASAWRLLAGAAPAVMAPWVQAASLLLRWSLGRAGRPGIALTVVAPHQAPRVEAFARALRVPFLEAARAGGATTRAVGAAARAPDRSAADDACAELLASLSVADLRQRCRDAGLDSRVARGLDIRASLTERLRAPRVRGEDA